MRWPSVAISPPGTELACLTESGDASKARGWTGAALDSRKSAPEWRTPVVHRAFAFSPYLVCFIAGARVVTPEIAAGERVDGPASRGNMPWNVR